MLDNVMNFLDEICMTVVGVGKALVDVYGMVIYGITGAIRNFGKAGTGVAVGGAIAMGGMVAAGWGTQPAQGQPLGQPWTNTSQQQLWSNQPQQQPVAGTLPGGPAKV